MICETRRRERYVEDEDPRLEDLKDLIPRFKRFKLKPSPAQFRLQTERDNWLDQSKATKTYACIPCIQPELLKATWTSKIGTAGVLSVDFEFTFQSNYPHIPPKIKQTKFSLH
eukprot:GEMP01049697.1.p1 GENE.GEMP01049697.1~~GEMP01049697.1.p1  ORF type:complete len:126 (+),score=8.70 GEMP01049697.1:41-379(+)